MEIVRYSIPAAIQKILLTLSINILFTYHTYHFQEVLHLEINPYRINKTNYDRF